MTAITEPQIREMIAVVNSRNVDKVMDQFAEDATFQTPNEELPVQGRAAIRTVYSNAFAAFPDWTIEPKTISVVGSEVLIVNSVHGTHDGPLTGAAGKSIPATHRKFSQEQMTRVVLNEKGKVQSLRAYGNPAELLRQLGL
ncbi:MAG TPA: nuclear transport factor 2 family protein [Thermoplasmata archaeon]|nr:nuclear transport factor 2 family protein [Thermoplasmata archaeon]